ncbi:hypothetical protein, partial [Flavobacterium sp.]
TKARLFQIFTILLLSFFIVLKSLLKRLSIQYVYERILLFLTPLFRLAGAKVTLLFKLTRLFKIIFEFILNPSFFQFFKERPSLAGCKYKNTFLFNPNLL